MNNNTVIKAENLSKIYNVSPIRSIWSKVPFFGNHHNKHDHLIWALKDIDFEVKKGETLGIIGPNGAGKSTLLKVLCGVTKPSSGNFQIKGRIAPLIEIGAGFHPEMTGRENIYLNGAIIGMSKKELDRKFKDIVDFSELWDFIDTPCKKYSSGMKVRLGFSIAVHVEPDILLVDEVLAVGDVGFRAKCYNRLAELMNNCAVVFVSHYMPAISRMSSKCIVLNKGDVVFQGASEEAIQHYLSIFGRQKTKVYSEGLRLVSCDFNAKKEKGNYMLTIGEALEITFELDSEIDVEQTTFMVKFLSSHGEYVAEWNSYFDNHNIRLDKGHNKFKVLLHPLRLNPGTYSITLTINPKDEMHHLLWIDKGWTISLKGNKYGSAPYQIRGSVLC